MQPQLKILLTLNLGLIFFQANRAWSTSHDGPKEKNNKRFTVEVPNDFIREAEIICEMVAPGDIAMPFGNNAMVAIPVDKLKQAYDRATQLTLAIKHRADTQLSPILSDLYTVRAATVDWKTIVSDPKESPGKVYDEVFALVSNVRSDAEQLEIDRKIEVPKSLEAIYALAKQLEAAQQRVSMLTDLQASRYVPHLRKLDGDIMYFRKTKLDPDFGGPRIAPFAIGDKLTNAIAEPKPADAAAHSDRLREALSDDLQAARKSVQYYLRQYEIEKSNRP